MKQYLRCVAVADRLGISLETLRRYIKNGTCPQYRRLPGGIMLFLPTDVERWVAELEDLRSDPLLAPALTRPENTKGPLLQRTFVNSERYG